ncbi:MAG TPA: hypothetical protein DHV36_15740, partial [Desulfobacteraceae bacterium]|nr:hypothetical protein [Desulfobacteraceae bacterium]
MISLYGSLARAFKEKYKLDPTDIPIHVQSVAEMMKAMTANFPGFRALFEAQGHYRVVRGDSFDDGHAVDENEIDMVWQDKDWHIMPVAAGAKKDGLIQTIIGVALIGIGMIP